ncbi:MAG TPA: hypothetical protein VK483_13015 [Chitinophagaceae bacterium]|nr:hypothetical protein [Chitinophagaceae bacterium]
MKKIILFILLLTLSATSFSQQTKSSPTLTRQDYLKKSSSQKFVAWTLLGGAVIALSLAAMDADVCMGPGCTKNSFPSAAVGIGAVCVAGSIPFFIASAKNKRRAMSVSFKNETIPSRLLSGQKSSYMNISVPSLTLKINL